MAAFPEEVEEEEDEDVVKVAIIGKPNVGKSSLLNRILGEERVIVSNVAGTTRDAIDSYFENEHGKYLFIDTAGMRRKSKVDDAIERYSNLRTVSAIERADVCLILVDAQEGVTDQDTKIAGLAHEAGKASIIVVNKWDAVEKDTNTMAKMTEEVRRDLAYMTYAPVVFLSALTGQRVAEADYQTRAEENMMNLLRENAENKKRMALSVICGCVTVIAVCALVALASFLEVAAGWRVALLALALLTAAAGIAAAAMLEASAGYYQCPNCQELFVPTMGAYVKCYHTLTKRRLKCPHCGKVSMCKHRITR